MYVFMLACMYDTWECRHIGIIKKEISATVCMYARMHVFIHVYIYTHTFTTENDVHVHSNVVGGNMTLLAQAITLVL